MGGGTPTATTTQTPPAPWGGQKKYLKDIYAQAQALSGTPLQYYPDSTVADFGATTQEALGGIANQARAGSPTLEGASGYTQDVLAGKYLDPNSNPYLTDTFNLGADALEKRYNQAVLPGLEARFRNVGGPGYAAAYGRTADELSTELGDLATRIYGGAYENERTRQEAAAGRAPSLAQAEYLPGEMLRNVGAQEDALAQAKLDDLVARFQFNQNEPWDRLSRYQAGIGSPIVGGGTAESKQPFDWQRALLGLVGLRG